jgi:penicillin-binding protein 2
VQPSYYPIVLKEDLTIEDLAFVAAHRLEFPGLDITPQPRRLYGEGDLAAHLLGYVGEISEKELDRPEFKGSRPGWIVGKSGVERIYNSILMGVDGQKKVVVDSRGKEVATLDTVDSIAGNDLRITLDLDLQRAAEKALGDQVGAAVALDPRTGEVLALVSRPAFDPNSFTSRISRKEWADLMNDPRKPMQNRAIQSRFPPGSVFKVFMTIAGLQEGILTPDYVDFCSGATVLYGRPFHCWRAKGHGRVDLHRAIVDSCNVFFYHLGQKLGIDKIARHAQEFGLGLKTGIDLPGEDNGIMPSPAWKRLTFKVDWYAGETISVAIGQGYVSLTPLQVARAFGALGLGGVLKTPHVVASAELLKHGLTPIQQEGQAPMNPITFDIVTRGLWGVVNESGTGTRAAIPGFDVCGKTGTAQVVGREAQKKGVDNDALGDNAWFVAFAPLGAPEIATAVFVEHGGHGGSTAAPVVHEILKTYYHKSRGIQEAPQVVALSRKP